MSTEDAGNGPETWGLREFTNRYFAVYLLGFFVVWLGASALAGELGLGTKYSVLAGIAAGAVIGRINEWARNWRTAAEEVNDFGE